MEIGASSACFYPLETEKAFLQIAELGFKHCEIFFNSHSELNRDFLLELNRVKEHYGMNVISIHPYRSFSEGYDFFSRYKRRFYDGVENYKRLFEGASVLGAKYVVMHGAKHRLDISLEEYAERFDALNTVAEEFGCSVVHENVVKCVGATPDFMKSMHDLLGDRFKAVLDIKQARRADVDPLEFIKVLGNSIVHVHLSDFDCTHDCIAPDEKGFFDFSELFTTLKASGYEGDGIIELYSDNFRDNKEIVQGAQYLREILKKVF